MPTRPIAQKIVIAAATTSTGNSTATAKFGLAYSGFTLYHRSAGSTKNIAFKPQGSVGESGFWTDLMAATTGSTAAAGLAVNTTSAFAADQVRINVTANATTGNTALTVWVVPRKA